jgi:hypothetical protein
MTTDGELLTTPPAAARLPARLVIDAWRGITRRQVVVTAMLGVLLHVSGILSGISGGHSIWFVLVTGVSQQIKAFMTLAAYVVADRVTGHDPGRRGPYALAVLIAALVSSPLAVAWVYSMAHFALEIEAEPSLWWLVVLAFVETTIHAGAAVWVILDWRRATRARARMHAAEVARAEAARRTLASRLQELQARVEPQFLFNTLASVEHLHRRDAVRATRMLDDLIDYLRSAMPTMRESSSTVARELDLVRAWLDIARSREADGFTFAIACEPATGVLRLPPMMLLPLVAHLFDRAHDGGPPRSLALEANADDRRLRMAIRARGWRREIAEAVGMADVRERMAALYGDRGSLDIATHDDSVEMHLALPREAAQGREAADSAGAATPVSA